MQIWNVYFKNLINPCGAICSVIASQLAFLFMWVYMDLVFFFLPLKWCFVYLSLIQRPFWNLGQVRRSRSMALTDETNESTLRLETEGPENRDSDSSIARLVYVWTGWPQKCHNFHLSFTFTQLLPNQDNIF